MTLDERFWPRAVAAIRETAGSLDDGFPYVTDETGRWKCLPANQVAGWSGNTWSHGNWFCGFWVGLLWLAFEIDGDADFAEQARTWAERMRFRQGDRNSHDIGFLFVPSYVKGFLLTREPEWRDPALTAARVLAERFDDRAGIVQAWGHLEDSRARGTSTIDTMMNLPLLWWAARETGEATFREIAARHAQVSASVYFREDGSTFHTARFDPASGQLEKRGTYQGLSGASCWSRGLSWAISGFAEAFRHTRNPRLLEASETAAAYYQDHSPADLVPYWDYQDPEIPAVPRDSAAAAIAAGGFLTLSEVHPIEARRKQYEVLTGRVLESLLTRYLIPERPGVQQGILGHACYSRPHNDGVDCAFVVGDFFFLQNLLRFWRPSAGGTSPFGGAAPSGELDPSPRNPIP